MQLLELLLLPKDVQICRGRVPDSFKVLELLKILKSYRIKKLSTYKNAQDASVPYSFVIISWILFQYSINNICKLKSADILRNILISFDLGSSSREVLLPVIVFSSLPCPLFLCSVLMKPTFPFP